MTPYLARTFSKIGSYSFSNFPDSNFSVQVKEIKIEQEKKRRRRGGEEEEKRRRRGGGEEEERRRGGGEEERRRGVKDMNQQFHLQQLLVDDVNVREDGRERDVEEGVVVEGVLPIHADCEVPL